MNEDFDKQLRNTLRENEAQLDTRTRARLAAARAEALEQAERTGTLGFGSTIPAWGTLAAVAVIAVIVLRVYTPLPDEPAIVSTAATDETLSAKQELEMYENLELLEFYEELEFYEWLAGEIPEERAS